MAPPPGYVLAFLSGLPVAAFGVLMLSLRPRRREQLFFGAFAVLWGLSIMAATAAIVAGLPTFHRAALLITYGLLPPATLFLTYFATNVRRGKTSLLPTLLMGVFGLVAAAVLVVDPSLVVASARGPPDPTVLGPLAFPLFLAPFFAAFYLAIALLYLDYRRAAPGTPRHRVRGVLLALVLFASYLTVRQLRVALDPTATTQAGDAIAAWGLPLLFGLGFLVILSVAVHLAVRPPPPEGRDAALLLAFILPAATALAELGLEAFDAPMTSLGFWRFATVAALVYTLAHHQLFDLDLKLKKFAGPGVAGIFLAFGIPVSLALASGSGAQILVPAIVIEVIGVGASLVFHNRIKEALFPGVEDRPDYVYQRKMEVYRTSLEDALARGAGPDDPHLKELRVRLGIAERDHGILAMVVAPTLAGRGVRAEEGAVVLDRYRLEKLLGAGTHGRTFVAQDRSTRHRVAVKVVGRGAMGGAAARLLLREARLGATLQHRNVVQIHDVAETPEQVVLVMELAEGGNLQQLIEREGTPTLETTVRILDGILAALEAVHERGIVHRNLKPSNVLLADDRTPKLSDFGAARSGADLSATEEFVPATLSLLHMSPEQVRGVEVGPASDLYSAAVLFYEVLTDRHYLPITGRDDFTIRQMIVEREPDLRLSGHPDWIGPFLRRALDKDPSRRYPGASAMRAALREGAGLTE